MAVLSSSTSCPKYAARSEVAPHYHGPVHPIKRIAAALTLLFGAFLYVWYAGVRFVPEVKRRKALLRASRRPH